MSVTLTRLWLRASADDQYANRARAALEAFAAERGMLVAGACAEDESGVSLYGPERRICPATHTTDAALPRRRGAMATGFTQVRTSSPPCTAGPPGRSSDRSKASLTAGPRATYLGRVQ